MLQVIKAALLDGRVYRDIAEEPEAMFRALGVVFATAIAFGLGLRNAPSQGFDESEGLLVVLGPQNVVMLVALSTVMVGWVLWAFAAYLIGTRLLRGKASYSTLLRALGTAYGPGVLMVLVSVPVAGGAILIAVSSWLLCTATVAVRETQGCGWPKALLVTIIGWFVSLRVLPLSPLSLLGP